MIQINGATDIDISKFAEYAQKWQQSAYSTNQDYDINSIIECVNNLYCSVGSNIPDKIIFTESPLHNFIAFVLILGNYSKTLGGKNEGNQLNKLIITELIAKVEPAVLDSVLLSLNSLDNLMFDLDLRQLENSCNNQKMPLQEQFKILNSLVKAITDLLPVSFNKIKRYLNGFESVRDNRSRTDRRENYLMMIVEGDITDLINSLGDESISFSDLNNLIFLRGFLKDGLEKKILSYSTDNIVLIMIQAYLMKSFCGNLSADIMFMYDYLREIPNLKYDKLMFEVIIRLYEKVGVFIPLKNICLVSAKPKVINPLRPASIQGRFNSGSKPVLHYCDDFQFWLYENVILDDKRYFCDIDNWKSEWLLTETNAEVRRVLLQALGPAKILSELGAVLLDSFDSTKQGRYELFKVSVRIDEEDYVLLKMICPSTGHVHVVRVPPAMVSAREAVKWVNHGVDPERFKQVG